MKNLTQQDLLFNELLCATYGTSSFLDIDEILDRWCTSDACKQNIYHIMQALFHQTASAFKKRQAKDATETLGFELYELRKNVIANMMDDEEITERFEKFLAQARE